MVALFGLSSKGSSAKPLRDSDTVIPPPPYPTDTSDSAVYATATTTTTTTHVVTTTTQTTHFFSLPLWRRRGGTHAYSPSNARSTDELGVLNEHSDHSPSSSTIHARNKDLPPTPELTPDNLTPHTRLSPDISPLQGGDGRTSNARTVMRSASRPSSRASSLQRVSRSSYAPSDFVHAAQPTVILARAALGLGLPHGAPASVSASSSSSEVNTVAFLPQQSPSTTDLRRPSLLLRHAKSFYKEPDSRNEAPAVAERRRARGLSLGPLHLMSSDAKGKQRETNSPVVSEPAGAKPLTRKSSFWSRKRTSSRPEPPALTSPTPRPTLPTFPPVSPFNINTPVPSSGLSVSNQLPDLYRRHSERTRKPSKRTDDESHRVEPPLRPSNSSIHARRRRPQRPQTADDTTVGGPRLSFFSEARPFISSPTSSPLATPLERPAPVFPAAPPEPRTRAQTNPPLLHRLSVNLFGSSSNTHTPTSISSPNIHDATAMTSPPSSLGSSRPSLSKPSVEIPRPNSDEETPEDYLQRLVEAISKGEVATVLASSADTFHARALRVYIERFNFVADPLDVAIRKLLMDVGLPRETQQIDRVIEAFAARYVQCNPNLFSSDDHPYILAFSLIMLHTDAFNKSNKRKMTKADYIKNTRLPGVAPEALDCFYDNIVFAPFIFIEDPLDVNGQRGLVPEAMSRRMSTINVPSPGGLNSSGSALLGKNTKIDPYYLIARNLLDDLRVDVYSHIPPESPYYYCGSAGSWDEDELQRAFALAATVGVANLDNRYTSSPWFSLSVSGGPGPMFQSSLGSLPPLTPTSAGVWNVKVTKVGLMLRKEDILEGGKRAMSRKWRELCVLLTGSQLMFFRDPTLAAHVQAQSHPTNGHLVIPHASLPQPEETYSVRDTIAVFDKTYTKHPHTLRFALPDGRQYLLQASDEKDMNEWISRINYAGAFKTAGVRMRALGLSIQDIELTGIAAAASHLKDIKHNLGHTLTPVIRTWDRRLSGDLDRSSRVTVAADSEPTRPSNGQGKASRTRQDSLGSAGSDPNASSYDNSARLFKATFDEVKTELAAGRYQSLDQMSIQSTRKRAYSLESTLGAPFVSAVVHTNGDTKPRLSTRPEIIKAKVEDLNSKLSLARTQLDTDMRFVRNLAVLTPFQRATRDRLQAAVQLVAKRVMQVRLDIEKLVCYREVLTSDLAAEERDWEHTKHLAMRAATQKLADQRQADREAERVVGRETLRERGSHPRDLAKLTLSAYVEQTAPATVSSPVAIPRRENLSRGQESSTAESFQTARSGNGSVWSGRKRSSTLTFGSPKTFESSLTSPIEMGSSATSGRSFPSPDLSERRRAVPLVAQASLESAASTDDISHEKFYTAPEMPEEQAEEWNMTRAAKRVSLVKLPSDLRISMLFGKHARDQTSTPEVAEDPASTPAASLSSGRRRSLNPYEHPPSPTLTMLDM
ncbi:hypothetical protein LXA43DRAFT_266533 [Ganoderma leucocontextum]|nr:hypothetical protein LXA43DRAFT_266533 [Ganoderma leucocontextum]